MKRFLIFTALFPPLALAEILTAPDIFAKYLDWLGMAYVVAMISCVVDRRSRSWVLSALKPTYLRIAGAAVAGAVSN